MMKTILLVLTALALSWSQIYNTRAAWTQVFVDSSINSSYLSCDATGKYLLCAGVGIPKRSVNYGVTWASVKTTGSWTGCRVSKAGKYQFMVKLTDSIYISKDSGATWTSKKIATGAYAYKLMCSYYGNIVSVSGGSVAAQGTKVYVSKDTGNTWTQTFTFDNSFIAYKGAMDSLGVYQIVLLYNDSVFISKDTGTTFSLLFYKTGHTRGIYSSDISFNAKHITLGCGLIGAVAGKAYYSSDTGVTFDSSAQTTSGLQCMSMSGDGKINIGAGCGDGYLISTNSGSSWLWVAKVSDGGGSIWAGSAITTNGKLIYLMQNTYCKIYKNQLIQPLRFQQTIVVDSLAFGEVDNNFLYTIPTSILSSVFKNNSASDKRDIRVYNSFGTQLKNEVFANGNYLRWLDTAKNTADRVFTFKTGSGDILAYDSTMYINTGCVTMYHCEDSSTVTKDATGKFNTNNILTLRNQTGKVGQCYYLAFDGTPAHINYIASATACNYDLNKPWSVSGWFKMMVLPTHDKNGYASCYFSNINSAKNRGWEFVFNNDRSLYRGELDYFASTPGSTLKAFYKDYDTIYHDVWSKITLTYNPTGNVITYYRDGKARAWSGYYGAIAGTSLPTNGFYIGTSRGTVYLDSTYGDEFRIDSLTLSENQIAAYYKFDCLDSVLKYVTVDSSAQFLGDTGNVWIGAVDSCYSNPANWSKGVKPTTGAIILDSMALRPLYVDSALTALRIKTMPTYQGKFVQQATIKVTDTLQFQHYGDLVLSGNDTITGNGVFKIVNIGSKACSTAVVVAKDSCRFFGSVKLSRIKYTGGYAYRHHVSDTISFKNQVNSDFSGSDTSHRVILKSDTLTRRFFMCANSGIDSIWCTNFRDCWNLGTYIDAKKNHTNKNAGNNKKIYQWGTISNIQIGN